MTLMMKSCLVSLTILFLWQVADGAEACKCAPAKIQKAYCDSDVVIKAVVSGSQMVENGNDTFGNSTFGNSIKSIEYDVRVTKVYKGPTNINAVYTSPSSASCGATLDTGDKLYFITGKLQDGKVHISRCDFIQLWEDLGIGQKLKLFQCNTFGCSC